MTKRNVSCLIAFAAGTALSISGASADVTVLPAGAHAAHNFIPYGTGTSTTPTNNTTMHQVFAASTISALSGGLPITISDIGFAAGVVGTSNFNITINLGYTTRVPGQLSASGGLSVPTAGGGGAPNASGAMSAFYSNPAYSVTTTAVSTTNFNEIHFPGSFVYNPALGNLLVEIVCTSVFGTTVDTSVSRAAGDATSSRAYTSVRFAPAESNTTASRMQFTYTINAGVTGRCCKPDGSCIVATSAGCASAGGVYAGDGTNCTPNVCPQPPTGACCFANGSCSILSSANCTAGGGTYSGDNVTCAAANCPQPPPAGDVYAINNRDATHPFLKFPVNSPAYTPAGTVTPTCFAMDFNGDASTLYVITNNATVSLQELGTISQANGAYTTVALINGAGAAETNWGGMSFDKSTNTMYAMGIAAGINNLYTIDLATGATTLVAPVTGLPAGAIMIDFSINDAGTLMIGHEIVADQMWSINKATGAATLLGATGFAANFAQGMDFDPTSGKLYATLYVGGGVGNFVQVNTTTGACTSLAVTTAWAAGVGAEMEMAIKGLAVACYPNCDGSTSVPLLTANDFQCFLNEYAAGHSYANCDGSTNNPVLTANDFQCFLNAYAAGCS